MNMEIIIQEAGNPFGVPVSWNGKELQEKLKTEMCKFKNLQYSEDQLQEAKKDRATLNELKKNIDKRRIEIKKKYLKNYDVFEVQVKALTDVLMPVLRQVDVQVKAFENDKKAARRESLEVYFAENVGELREDLLLTHILKSEWLTPSRPITKVHNEMFAILSKYKEELEAINQMGNQIHLQIARSHFLKTFNFTAAMRKVEEFGFAEKRAEKKAQEEKEREIANRDAIRKPINEIVETLLPTREPVQSKQEPAQEPAKQELQLIKFWVKVTPEQKILCRDFFRKHRIEIGGIK